MHDLEALAKPGPTAAPRPPPPYCPPPARKLSKRQHPKIELLKRRNRTLERRRHCAVASLLCVLPFWVLSVALPLVAATRAEPTTEGRNIQLPSTSTTITITFIFAIFELFAFLAAMLAYGLNSGPTAYRRRLAFAVMGLVVFEAIASGAWVVSRALAYAEKGICSGALVDEVEECRAGLDIIMAMGAVRFGYLPCVLLAAVVYPGPWTKDPL